MATDVKIYNSTPVVFADSTDYSATASGYARTAQLDLTSIASAAARQSDKVDLGTPRAGGYAVRVGIEFDVAPTAATLVEFYWSASVSGTAGTGNDGGCSGADGGYKAGEEDEWKRQLLLIGVLVATNDAATTVEVQTINPYFQPPTRYGQVVVVNKSGQALEGDAVEMFVAFEPIIDQVQ
jgi:hypothetical protein